LAAYFRSSRQRNIALQQIAKYRRGRSQQGSEVVRLEIVDMIGSVEQFDYKLHPTGMQFRHLPPPRQEGANPNLN
jgi:hypothetical protein